MYSLEYAKLWDRIARPSKIKLKLLTIQSIRVLKGAAVPRIDCSKISNITKICIFERKVSKFNTLLHLWGTFSKFFFVCYAISCAQDLQTEILAAPNY